MAYGQSGAIGHNVLSLVVEAFRDVTGRVPLPGTMADGARAIALT